MSTDGKVVYEIRLASALTTGLTQLVVTHLINNIIILSRTAEPCDNKDHVASLLGTYNYQSTTIKVTRGDYAPLMQRMVDNLDKAKVLKNEIFNFVCMPLVYPPLSPSCSFQTFLLTAGLCS